MNNLPFIILLLVFGCSSEKAEVEMEEKPLTEEELVQEYIRNYTINVDSLGYSSPEKVANEVITFLQLRDTTNFFNCIIPLEVQKYLAIQNFQYRPDIEDKIEFLNFIEEKYQRRMNNFLERDKYIHEIMEEDKKFIISEAVIDTITYKPIRIKNYGGFDTFIVGNWADVTVKMSYKEKEFYFEIPQIIELENKWFLYYPEYYIRTKWEKEYIDEAVKNTNKTADEFWL